LLFVDADCKLEPGCLNLLSSTIENSPEHSCFQLHLTGDCTKLVGRAEELRLSSLQQHMLLPNGAIRYLNTAGFAIRRASAEVGKGLFDVLALRAEDTLLLANLMQRGELPLFASNALVQHAIPLSLLQYFRKAIRSAYLEARTYETIAARGVRIRVSNRERVKMLLTTWKSSAKPAIGRSAWFVLVAKQALQRTISSVYSVYAVRRNTRVSTKCKETKAYTA
jgi:hypothetical protein